MNTKRVGLLVSPVLGLLLLAACQQDNAVGVTRTTSGSVPVDDTQINQRDRPRAGARIELTPLDQGNDPEDLALAQQIRRALVSDSTLGTDAKNVKIIALHGLVTLRGPVRSQAERGRIAAAAASFAGAGMVDDQVDVERMQ